MSSQQKMQFFNFGNEETYDYFMWVTDNGGLDVDALVKAAFERVEGDEWFEMDEDVSTVAKAKLADLLEEQLCELLGVSTLENFTDEGLCSCCSEAVNHQTSLDALTRPLLARALGQICFEAAAEAILIRAGKWNPDKEPPEAVE